MGLIEVIFLHGFILFMCCPAKGSFVPNLIERIPLLRMHMDCRPNEVQGLHSKYYVVHVQISSVNNNSLSLNVLLSRGLKTKSFWYWIGVGVLIAYTILFNFMVTYALKYLDRNDINL